MKSTHQSTSRYYAYSNYFVATSRLIQTTYPNDSALARKTTGSRAYARLKRAGDPDRERIASLLRNSWFTELLLKQLSEHEDVLVYSNPWAMIQSYYATYLAIRAYFHACGRTVSDNHRATLATITSDLTSYKGRFPAPWCSVLTRDPNDKPLYFTNAPYAQPIVLKNPLRSPLHGEPWQHFGLFLKTTRARQIDTAVQRWKKIEGRKRILGDQRAELVSAKRATSIFDALYRVRARSNYQDVDSFAFGIVKSTDARMLHESICQIVFSSMLVFEALIARLMGKRWYSRQAGEFVAMEIARPANETVMRRWQPIEKLL